MTPQLPPIKLRKKHQQFLHEINLTHKHEISGIKRKRTARTTTNSHWSLFSGIQSNSRNRTTASKPLTQLSFIVYEPGLVQSSKTGLHKTLKIDVETSIKNVNLMLDFRYLTMRVKRHRRRTTTHPEAKVVLLSDFFFI
jgi:hypothetical protein